MEDGSYLSDDKAPLRVGPVVLERVCEHRWTGWCGGWRVSISRANPTALEGDRVYRGPWVVHVGQRSKVVQTITEGVDWIDGVLIEIGDLVSWTRRI